jgi:hypothetical protein
MPVALIMLIRLHQSPDTLGLRQALKASIAATVHKIAETNPWAGTSDHLVVDVASFLRVADVGVGESARWRSILDTLGSRATDAASSCTGEVDDFCPHLWAKSLTRTGNTLSLTVAMDRRIMRLKARKAVVIEMIVTLVRRGDGYLVQSLRYGMMT